MKISEIITDKYKLRIPPTVYYELMADIQELEENQLRITKNDLGVECVSRQAVDSLVWEYLRHETHETKAFYEHFLDLPPMNFRKKAEIVISQLRADRDRLADYIDKIRAELHATAEMHEDGSYYIRDEWIDEYFDKYKAESER